VHKSQLNREFDMSFKKASLVAMLAVSMTGTQVMAQTATAASAPAPTAAARSGARMADANELRGGMFIALLALIAIIIGILCAIQDNDGRPVSPG
jgi:hypothetical protein